MKHMYTLWVAVLLTFAASASNSLQFKNPVIRGDMADPSVILVDDTFYATGTSSEWAPYYPIFISTDLINWQQAGHVFDEKPEWTSHSFWAPELFYYKGTMYCYYSARRKTDNTTFIGVATAEGTSLEFTDHGPIIELGSEAIDAFIMEVDGALYISWKAYGLDPRPIELLGSRLSDDGLRLEGEPFSLMRDDEEIGLEGQYHFKHGDYYYIIYSAKSCCGPGSDYDVRAARSKQFFGPYEKYDENPILSGGEGDFQSVGHGTGVTLPDGRYFYLSHGYMKGDEFYMGRQPVLHEFVVNDEQWVEFTTGPFAMRGQSFPFDGTVQGDITDFYDDFTGESLKVDWTWNYPFADVHTKLVDGQLHLSGTPIGDHTPGAALCLRPGSTDYVYEASIANKNDSFKGLTMYGDDKNQVALGYKNDRILLVSIQNGTESILFDSSFEGTALRLKVEVAQGRLLSFYYSADGEQWTRVNESPLDVSFLVRWDRVARPGLLHKGAVDSPALFNHFSLKHQ